jgi:hypothetical protein
MNLVNLWQKHLIELIFQIPANKTSQRKTILSSKLDYCFQQVIINSIIIKIALTVVPKKYKPEQVKVSILIPMHNNKATNTNKINCCLTSRKWPSKNVKKKR